MKPTAWTLVFLLAPVCGHIATADDNAQLASQAVAVFEKYCHRCHGPE